jgi:signal peptidase I
MAAAVPALEGLAEVKIMPFGQPKRGDIVVFRYPRDPSRDFIKRVVALPGETVEIKAGQVYVNNQRLEEPYIMDNPTYSKEPAVVLPDQYFVLGDNRNNSSDSHVWGPVPVDNVIGKAWLTYWPIQDWGSIPDHAAAFADR